MIAHEAPCDTRNESLLIGSCLAGGFKTAVDDYGVEADWFYDLKLQAVWRSMEGIDAKGGEVNEISVTVDCKEYSPVEYVNLLESAGSRENLPVFARKAREVFSRRQAWHELHNINSLLQTTQDPAELVQSFEAAFLRLADTKQSTDRDQRQSLREYVDYLQSAFPDGLPSGGHDSGLFELDSMLRSYGPGTMNIIAARPGCGKTSFAIHLAMRFAAQAEGGGVLFYSLEMPYEEMLSRMLAYDSGCNVSDYLHTGSGPLQKMLSSVKRISELPIHIEDRPDVSIQSLRNQVRRLVKTKKITSVFVDYLQLLSPGVKLDNRAVEVGHISRQLKMLAKEFNLPVICLAQLNREVEARAGRPRLSDLRESGSIEQDADSVMFLSPSKDDDENCNPNESVLRVYLEKNRSGMTGDCRLAWDKALNRFEGFVTQTE